MAVETRRSERQPSPAPAYAPQCRRGLVQQHIAVKSRWQLYDERGFKGDMAALVGPVALESEDRMAGRQVKRHIDSLITGLKATLRVYEHAMLKDRSVVFGPTAVRAAC